MRGLADEEWWAVGPHFQESPAKEYEILSGGFSAADVEDISRNGKMGIVYIHLGYIHSKGSFRVRGLNEVFV